MLTNKVCLISLSFLDNDEIEIDNYYTGATIEALTNNELLIMRRFDGSLFQLPYDEEMMNPLEPEEYTDKGTGDIISNPDYIITWEIMVDDVTEIEEIKKFGYIEG